MLGDINARNLALGASVLATLVGISLYVVGVLLSSKIVRGLLVSAWAESCDRADRATLQRHLRLASAMLSALFESERGFSANKFVLLMLVINSGAILGLLLNLGIESDQLVVRDALSTRPYDGDDSVADAFLGVVLSAPLLLVSWSAFDYLAYRIARWQLARAVTKNSISPVLVAFLFIVGVSYLLPFLTGYFFLDSKFGLYAVVAPLMPLVASLTSFSICWQCSLLSLPAGLSVTLSTLLLGLAVAVLSSRRSLSVAARICECLENTSANWLRNLALEVITVSGAVIVLVTWKELPWNG
jgi:hypothetical protein